MWAHWLHHPNGLVATQSSGRGQNQERPPNLAISVIHMWVKWLHNSCCLKITRARRNWEGLHGLSRLWGSRRGTDEKWLDN